jgi:hypothetical protein
MNYTLKIHSSLSHNNATQIEGHHWYMQHSYCSFSKVLAKYGGGPHSETSHALL